MLNKPFWIRNTEEHKQQDIKTKCGNLVKALITALDNEGILDKEPTSYDDIFDAYRLALEFYHHKSE